CRCQPKGVSPRIPQPGLRKCCWLRLWILLRLWMSDVFQLLGTLRNKLRGTLRHLRQQLRHSLRASEIRLRRTVRTDFLLRVPATLVIDVTDGVADERSLCSYGALMRSAPCLMCALEEDRSGVALSVRMTALISLKPSESETKSSIWAIDDPLSLEFCGANAFGRPSKKKTTGTCRMWEICCNRPAAMRLMPVSFFCTCW